MKQSIAYGAATSQGHASVQEDGFYLDPSNRFFLLANGMGGKTRGDKTVRDVLLSISTEIREMKLSNFPVEVELTGRSPIQTSLVNLFHLVNKKIVEQNKDRDWLNKSALSLTLACISANQVLHVISCGSSTILLQREGRIRIFSRPQLIRSSSAHVATGLMGMNVPLQPVIESIPLFAGDVVFMCTDGFSNACADVPEFLSSITEQFPRQAGDSLMPIAQAAIQALEGSGGALQNATLLAFEAKLSA